MRIIKSLRVASVLVMALSVPIDAQASTFVEDHHAFTFVQDSDECGNGGCGKDTRNTVSVTGANGVFTIDVSLAPGWFFQGKANTVSNSPTFAFSNPANFLPLEPISGPGGLFQEWQLSGANSGFSMGGIFVPAIAYGVVDVSKVGTTTDHSLIFTVVGVSSSETLSQFITSLTPLQGGSSGAIFAADVFSPKHGGVTGIIDFSPSPVSVPGPIVGAGLPGLILAGGGLLGWWRRRQRTS